MDRSRLRKRAALAAATASLSVLLALPQLSAGGVREIQNTAADLLDRQLPLTKQLRKARLRERDAARRLRATTDEPQTQPPLHGTLSHGQGTVAVLDLNPDSTRPQEDDPAGSGEDVVVGRTRGERRADGSYHGHVTIAALFGNEILGVDTAPGESKHGPLDAIQTQILDALCNGTGDQICLTVLKADSETSGSGSKNSFSVAHATLGGADGIDVGAAESNGNVSGDGQCESTHGDSQVANARAGGSAIARLLTSNADATACKSGATGRDSDSRVIELFGSGIPLPAPGCADGTPDTVTGIPVILPIVCNAFDDNGQGSQASAPYIVREALSVMALASSASGLLKAVTGAAEAHSIAPRPECSDGVDNDGDGKIDFPADPGCTSPDDDSERDDGAPTGGAGGAPTGGAGRDGEDGAPVHGGAEKEPGIKVSDTPSGRDDSSTRVECSDSADNDGDGKVDFPADPGCTSPDDDSERDTVKAGALATTGADLLLLALAGLASLGCGLGMRRTLGRASE